MSRIVSLLVRLIRLPIDLILLTVDLFRIWGWRFSVWLWWQPGTQGALRSGSDALHFGACKHERGATAAADGRKVRLCGPGRKYGNPELLSFICSALEMTACKEKRVCATCLSHGIMGYSYVRLFFLCLLMAAVWAGVAYLGYTGWRRATGSVPTGGAPVAFEPSNRGGGPDGPVRAEKFVARGKALAAGQHWAEARIEYANAVQQDPGNLAATLGVGRCYVELGLTEEAKDWLQKAVAKDPKCIEAYLGLAKAALASRNPKAALDHAAKALDLDRNAPGAHILLARAHLGLDDTAAAKKELDVALAADAKDTDALLARGAVALKENRLKDAETDYQTVLQLAPSKTEARIGLARVFRGRNDIYQAVTCLRDIIQADPTNGDAAVELGEFYAGLGQAGLAIDLYKKTTAANPRLVLLRARTAELLSQSNRSDEAYAALVALLTEYPGYVDAHVLLADLFLRKGLFTLASEQCAAALRRNPKDARAAQFKIRADMEGGRPADALPVIEGLLQQAPDNLELKIRRGQCYAKTGKYDQAEKCFRAAHEEHRDSSVAAGELALLFAAQHRPADAINWYRAALKRAPDDVLALNNLAGLLVDQPDSLGEALQLAERAQRLAPGNPMIQDMLGWVHVQRKEFDAGLSLLREVIQKMPWGAPVHYHLAGALAGKGFWKEADQAVKMALALSANLADDKRVTALQADIDAHLTEGTK